MSLTSGTIRLLKNIIHSTNCSDEDLRQIMKHAQHEIQQRSGVRPAPSASPAPSARPIKVMRNHPKLKPAVPPSGNTNCDDKSISDMSADDFKKTWVQQKDRFDDGGMDYSPTKKEYEDTDFEDACGNREHIDNVMRGIMR